MALFPEAANVRVGFDQSVAGLVWQACLPLKSAVGSVNHFFVGRRDVGLSAVGLSLGKNNRTQRFVF